MINVSFVISKNMRVQITCSVTGSFESNDKEHVGKIRIIYRIEINNKR